MTRQVQIPDESVEAGARELYEDRKPEIDPLEWSEIGDWRQDIMRREARAAIAAALSAWPGGTHRRHDNQEWLDLPLPPDNPELPDPEPST